MKCTCLVCSCAMRVQPVDARFFEQYSLYAHDSGGRYEAHRQAAYADWIAGLVAAPDSVFEAGCGNGSLLLALRDRWHSAKLRGCEPARGAAEHARRAGLGIENGYLEEASFATPLAEVALAVNVLEHVHDPITFLATLARHASREVVIVCPNGEVPSVELLFADHLYSLTRANVAVLFARAGLCTVRQTVAPPSLGEFVMTIGRRAESQPSPSVAEESVIRARFEYLRSWQTLDAQLIARIGGSMVTCFGTGEAAALLRTYAPQSWARVEVCTADESAETTFGATPIVPYGKLSPRTILLGTKPSVQPALTARLERDGHHVVSWSDLIAA